MDKSELESYLTKAAKVQNRHIVQEGKPEAGYYCRSDKFREKWDLTGIQQDAQLLFDVSYNLVNSNDWPKWAKISEFQRPR
ncbi:hypothetical protein [Paraglaciecola algarum]|uniref:hypothetical protein n=1 Tax=Paraglaciecola algarum TaxID=3050085 RepID=UPI00351D2A9C